MIAGFTRCLTRLCVMALVLIGTGAYASQEPLPSDVRVLVDISGSMRQTDPQNLRRPALRMLAGLLQPGTRAGVWTFARWVNNLVPVSEVDDAWKQRLQSLSQQIGSPGQFTNIEEVLDKATRDWIGTASTHARHLVLLTDGMVDVSKVEAENRQSRTRVIEEILPRLKTAGIKLHTVALSADADHELMRLLAGETGGRYQQVMDAAQLQRVFLKMFETVGTPDALPLEGNRFVVDASVTEATVLVFSQPGAPAVALVSPTGQSFSDSDLPGGVAWYRDEGYDLITLGTPQKGEWVLQADVDPDNRVMVVTDLRLQTSKLPSHMALGETLSIETYLSNRGERVTREAFLRLLELRAGVVFGDRREALALNDRGEGLDSEARDGRYSAAFRAEGAPGEIEILIAADSPTFMRERRFALTLHEPLTGLVEDSSEGPVLLLQVETAVLQPDYQLEAWQQIEGQEPSMLDLQSEGSQGFRATLRDAQQPVNARLVGVSRLGNRLERQVGPLYPPGAVVPVVSPTEPSSPAPAEVVEAVVVPPAQQVAEAQTEAAPEVVDDAANWLMPALGFGVVNLLLILGGLIWWWRSRARAAPQDADLDDMLGDGAAAQHKEDAA